MIGRQAVADSSDVLKASLDQDVRQLQESCRKVETDDAIARFTAEHANEADVRDQLAQVVMSCSFPLSLAWSMAEKGTSFDKAKNKMERTCVPLAPKPKNLPASFLTWSATQPAEFLKRDALTGALTWAETYFECKPA
jgi:hypothetical protein